MGYNYVVFGAGKVGQAVVKDLIENCDANKVLVIDPNLNALNELSYDKVLCSQAVWACDLRDEYDVAISCAPYKANPELCSICTGARIPFLDLGGNPDSFETIQRHCGEFNVKTPVITDCGLAPGICNMFAAYLAGRHGCKDIEIVCGGIPVKKPDNEVYHISAFSPEGLRSEYSGKCPCIVDDFVGFEDAQDFVTQYGKDYEIFPTSNNSFFTAEYLRSLGAQNHRYQTLRWRGHANAMLEHSVEDIPFEDHEDKVVLNVTGKRSGKVIGFDVVVFGFNGFTAMAQTTAVGITSIAHHVARGGKVLNGFQTPEQLWAQHELMGRLFEIFDIDER